MSIDFVMLAVPAAGIVAAIFLVAVLARRRR
jgi:hypothetical protein